MNAAGQMTLALAAAVFAAGCASTGSVAPAPAAADTAAPAAAAAKAAATAEAADADPAPAVANAVGGNVADMIAAAGEGTRIEFYDVEGNALEALPEDAPGSVSIHMPDGAGQQNFAFGPDGRILAHKISVGENYSKGVWVDVE